MAKAKRRNISMDDDMFDYLRKLAYERRQPMSRIIRDSILYRHKKRRR